MLFSELIEVYLNSYPAYIYRDICSSSNAISKILSVLTSVYAPKYTLSIRLRNNHEEIFRYYEKIGSSLGLVENREILIILEYSLGYK